MDKEIYFDNSATTRVHPTVVNLVHETMICNYGNPYSLHKKGVQAEQAVSDVRKIIADALEVMPEEIYFTSGGTESNNISIKGIANAYKSRGNHIIASHVEHPSVLNVFERLSEMGFRVTYLSVGENGVINPQELIDALCNETILVSLMHVNNEVGAIQPIKEIGEILKGYHKKVYYHVDAVQSFGKVPVLPGKWGIDMLSISGHKLHGPKGIGVLYLRKGTRVEALVEGGGQEKGIRAGTENVPGIVGLGKAADIATKDLAAHGEKMNEIRKALMSGIQKQIPECRINSNFDETGAPHILNISFPGIKSEVLLHYLEQDGIFVSSGSACSARKGKMSYVLTAMKRKEDEMEGSIRFSFSYMNEMAEVMPVVNSVKRAVEELQNLMGVKKR